MSEGSMCDMSVCASVCVGVTVCARVGESVEVWGANSKDEPPVRDSGLQSWID